MRVCVFIVDLGTLFFFAESAGVNLAEEVIGMGDWDPIEPPTIPRRVTRIPSYVGEKVVKNEGGF